jgi:hypothetical protein
MKNQWTVTKTSGILLQFLVATAVVGESSSAPAAEIKKPTEGQEIVEGNAFAIEIDGNPNQQLSLKWTSTAFGQPAQINVTLDGIGRYSEELSSTDLVGDHVLQLRSGHNNWSGATLDTITFTVIEDDDPGEGGEPE